MSLRTENDSDRQSTRGSILEKSIVNPRIYVSRSSPTLATQQSPPITTIR
jgi:hypothetical protein